MRICFYFLSLVAAMALYATGASALLPVAAVELAPPDVTPVTAIELSATPLMPVAAHELTAIAAVELPAPGDADTQAAAQPYTVADISTPAYTTSPAPQSASETTAPSETPSTPSATIEKAAAAGDVSAFPEAPANRPITVPSDYNPAVY